MESKIEKIIMNTNKIGIDDSYEILNDTTIPEKSRSLLYKSSKKLDDKIISDIIAKKDKVAKLKKNFFTEVEKAFNSTNKHKKYISFIRKKRKSLKDLSLRGAVNIDKQRDIILKDIEILGKKNSGDIKNITKKITVQSQGKFKAIRDTYGIKAATTIYQPVTPDPNPITVHTPPFTNMTPYSKTTNWLMDNYTSSQFNSVDPNSGRVWHSNTLRNNDADNWDPAFVETESGFIYVYTVPVTGKIKIILKSSPWRSDHICTLVDEFGISDSDVYQFQFNGVHIISPSGTETLRHRKSDWWENGYNNGSWSQSYLSRNSTLWDAWTSQKSYPSGTVVLIKVHSLLQNLPTVNDVSVLSTMDFYWTFKRITLSKG